MIAGYPLRRQVEAHIAALEAERRAARDERHTAAVDAALEAFRAELERMEATGEGAEPTTTNPALGTPLWVGPQSMPER